MYKKYFYFALVLALSTAVFSCKKNETEPVPTPTSDGKIYVAGVETYPGKGKEAKYWKDGVPVVLSDSATVEFAVANCIVVVGKDVYVGGSEISLAQPPTQIAKYWKNGKGINLTLPNENSFPEITSIAVSGNDVYAAGHDQATRGNGIIEVAKYWKNGTPVSLTGGSANSRDAGVNAIAVVGNDVYAAGFENIPILDQGATTYIFSAKYWKNGIDIKLSGTGQNGISIGNSIAVAGNNVYVAGFFGGGAGKQQIAGYWKNGIAVNVTDGSLDAEAKSIVAIGDDIYVAGYERSTKNVKVAKYWKNGTAISLTDGTREAVANAITVVGNDIYVAGYELNKEYAYIAKYWKNGTAVNLTNGSTLGIANSIFVAP
jgi:hypothetical protein